MQVKTNNSSFANKKPDNKPSCEKCGHVVICAIYKAVKPLMGNWPEELQPFAAEDLSKICNQYAEQFIAVKSNDDEFGDGR